MPFAAAPEGAGLGALRRCAGDPERFVAEIWGRQALIRDDSGERFDDLLSLDDVDALVAGAGLRTPAYRLVQDGTVLPESSYTRSATVAGRPLTGLVDPAKALALFEGGATIVLQALHRYWPPITALCRDLEAALGHPCQANAYITPPGSQGFAKHSDSHDVFVLQLAGSKTWEIDPAPGDAEGQPRTVEMRAGTAAYLPTGTPHSARTQRDVSAHLTVGVLPVTWREVLSRAVSRVLADPAYDGPLPAGYHRAPQALTADLAAHLDRVAKDVARLDPEPVAEAEGTRFLTGRGPHLRGGLLDRLAVAGLDDATFVRRRPHSFCAVRPAGGRVTLLLGDRMLRLPGWTEPALRYVESAPAFAVGDLAPWLDAESRLVLVRRLVREGLLEVDG